MLPSTKKRQNHNLDKKMAGANETKAATQRLAAEETLLSIAAYKEGEMAALIESITSPNTKKSTAIVQHSLLVCSPSSYRPKCFWRFLSKFRPFSEESNIEYVV